jgi:hypothetical protein
MWCLEWIDKGWDWWWRWTFAARLRYEQGRKQRRIRQQQREERWRQEDREAAYRRARELGRSIEKARRQSDEAAEGGGSGAARGGGARGAGARCDREAAGVPRDRRGGD